MLQTFSIKFKSGERLGHAIVWTLFLFNHSDVVWAEWIGALFCPKSNRFHRTVGNDHLRSSGNGSINCILTKTQRCLTFRRYTYPYHSTSTASLAFTNNNRILSQVMPIIGCKVRAIKTKSFLVRKPFVSRINSYEGDRTLDDYFCVLTLK